MKSTTEWTNLRDEPGAGVPGNGGPEETSVCPVGVRRSIA